MMDLQQIIFYCFASLTVLSAVMIVTQANPVRSVLFLVFGFFSSSVLWLLVNAEFLALVLVLVYVGAVMTLFLFVIMMVNIDVESTQTRLLRYLPFGLLLVASLVGLLYIALPPAGWLKNAGAQGQVLADTQAIGMVLYTHYVLAFELAAVILLVAIVAAITLAHRVAPTSAKRQNTREQLMVNREERVSLVAMRAEHNKDNS
ncbi:MAG: NADH-quinone oxidoreductase subunit J [Legionellales bacterium]|nr:NADH-quinone oxidoreductase subunit J [Legionellales bacterium]NDH66456.1 NADH-quinone oxidoreductase subunit J [Gammaproteobacteria bacterium]